MSEQSQRLDVAAARAAAAVLAAHVHLSHAAAARLASRIFPQRTIELYCDAHDLEPGAAEWVRIHALARVGLQSTARAHEAEERRLRAGLLRFQDWMRLHMAPHRDPVLRELLQSEIAHSRVCLIRLHARNATRYAQLAAPGMSAAVAVSAYLDRLDVDVRLHAAVHALALDRLREQQRRALPPAEPRPLRVAKRPRTAERRAVAVQASAGS